MALSSYDAWRTGDIGASTTDPSSPAYDSSRDEALDERATELTEQRMSDHDALTAACEDVLGFSDWTDTIASDMAQVLGSSDAAFEAEAVRFFSLLYKRVEKDIRAVAETDAEAERDRWEQEQEEMRSGADLRGGAA